LEESIPVLTLLIHTQKKSFGRSRTPAQRKKRKNDEMDGIVLPTWFDVSNDDKVCVDVARQWAALVCQMPQADVSDLAETMFRDVFSAVKGQTDLAGPKLMAMLATLGQINVDSDACDAMTQSMSESKAIDFGRALSIVIGTLAGRFEKGTDLSNKVAFMSVQAMQQANSLRVLAGHRQVHACSRFAKVDETDGTTLKDFVVPENFVVDVQKFNALIKTSTISFPAAAGDIVIDDPGSIVRSVDDKYYYTVDFPEELNTDERTGKDRKDFSWVALAIDHAGKKLQLGRYAGYVMRKVLTTDTRNDTYTWETLMKYEDWIARLFQPGTIGHQRFLGAQWPIAQMCKMLETSFNPQFPVIMRDRRWFSFKNGIFDIEDCSFYTYGNIPLSTRPAPVKYHDLHFDPSWTDPDFYIDDIPTPSIDSIFESQDIEGNHLRQIYALLGRQFFRVGQCDNWGLILFLYGVSNTGKSIITKVATSAYEDVDVGIIADSIESTFGYSKLPKKKICYCSEVTDKFRFDQSLMQNWATGEGVSFAVKNGDPIDLPKLEPHLMLAGNSAMTQSMTDNGGGSLSRRLATVRFQNRIDKHDTTLEARCLDEMAAFICKSIRYYHRLREEHPTEEFWSFCDPKFTEAQKELQRSLNPFAAFLGDTTKINMGDDFECSLSEFKASFRLFCTENNIRRVPPWTETSSNFPSYELKADQKQNKLRGCSLADVASSGEAGLRGSTSTASGDTGMSRSTSVASDLSGAASLI